MVGVIKKNIRISPPWISRIFETIAKIYLAFGIATLVSCVYFFPLREKYLNTEVEIKTTEPLTNSIFHPKRSIFAEENRRVIQSTDDNQKVIKKATEIPISEKPTIKQTVYIPLVHQINNGGNFEDSMLNQPSFVLLGIDFAIKNKPIFITFLPRDPKINRGKSITIRFRPGETCAWGEKRACVYSFKSTVGQDIIFITVHSGVGGEAQGFRNAIEGTGINGAKYSLEQTMDNMESLTGSEVLIRQGDNKILNLSFTGMIRIPSISLTNYINLPVEESIDYAFSIPSSFTQEINPSIPMIIIETCGWRMRGEAKTPGISPTSSSIYLGIIQPEIP
jgi:hypothetical protein